VFQRQTLKREAGQKHAIYFTQRAIVRWARIAEGKDR